MGPDRQVQPDRQVKDAFDRLVERREASTDVAAVLVDVVDRRPWWHRFRFPIALAVTAGAAAAVLLAIFGSGAAREAVETDPGLATVPPNPPTTEILTTEPTATIPTSAPGTFEVFADTEAAIRAFLEARGDDYLGPCSEPAPGQRCTNLAEPGHGGVEWHQVIFDDGDTGESLAVAPVEGGWLVVDTAIDGHTIDRASFDAGDSLAIEWVSPAGRTVVHTVTDPDASAVDGLTDVWVGEDLTGTTLADDGVCRRSIVRIDSATGTVTAAGSGHRPVMSANRRFLAYRGSEHEGSMPTPNASCAVDGRLIVHDIYLDRTAEIVYENGGDIGGIADVFWSPDSAHLAVVDGPDTTRSSIVAVEADGSLSRVGLDREVPELNGMLSNEAVEWESPEILLVRFYDFEGLVPDVLARYRTDGSFAGLVVPENTIDPVVDLDAVDWPAVLTNTPGLTYEAEPAAGPPPREGLGPYVQIGSSAGWADLDAIRYVDLGGPDGDTTVEAVITLVGGGNAGNAGVLVYAAGEEGPILVGPTAFYETYPGINAAVITDRLVAPLIVEQYHRADWVPRAAGYTGVSSRSYRLADGALELVDQSEERSLDGGLLELRFFFQRLIDGDVEAAEALLAPDAELNILGATTVAGAMGAVGPWQSITVEVDDGTTIFNAYGVVAVLDGGGADPRPLFGSNSCTYDQARHQCLLTRVSIEVDDGG